MAANENLPYILIATAHKPLGFLCSMERSSWPCQTTKQFKLQTLKSFRFLFSILFYLSHNKFATVETFWGKANNFSAFFFTRNFRGVHPGISLLSISLQLVIPHTLRLPWARLVSVNCRWHTGRMIDIAPHFAHGQLRKNSMISSLERSAHPLTPLTLWCFI